MPSDTRMVPIAMQDVQDSRSRTRSNALHPAAHILGSTVDFVGKDEAIRLLESWMRAGRECRHVVVTGFHGLWEAHEHREFRAILNAADLWVPDGIAPVLIARWLGYRRAERIPGAELMTAYFQRANEAGYRSFFYGDSERTLASLQVKLERDYPGHKVVGTLSPPFRALTPEEDEAHIRIINEARPDVLWVGLGLPKQERWIHSHRNRLDVPVAVGVGAAFGFLSGNVKRAPAWVGSLGFEWAYRLIREPRKCWRRSLVEGPQFIAHVLMELTGIRTYD